MLTIDLLEAVPQQRFGDLIGVSQQTVSELLARGVLTQGESAGAWLLEYCGHLREVAAGRYAAGDIDLATERALLAREQRTRLEMQNAVTRRELTPTVVLEQVLAGTAAKVAGVLDAIPGMVRRRVPQLVADDIDLIAGEIAKARNTVASMSLDDVLADAEEAAIDDTEDAQDLGSEHEPCGQAGAQDLAGDSKA